MRKKIVALTGAGISAESGIPTFRDSGGLWEGFRVEDVATPEGWHKDESLVYPIAGWELKIGDKCEKGSQLRPNIVWFGEMVPMMEVAAGIASKADIFLVVGTSMVVYPAAGLIDYVGSEVPKYIVDPN